MISALDSVLYMFASARSEAAAIADTQIETAKLNGVDPQV
jgi:hypothetical protein